MRNIGKSSKDEKWLKAFGAHISQLIEKKGYSSPYDFWIKKGDEMISRATLNYIIQGKSDPKLSTLRILARMLRVNVRELFDF